MDNLMRRAILNALELKLRRCKGVQLQEFFAALMGAKHGATFIPTSTDYSRGDLKCDGLLLDPLSIFACYGPVNAGENASDGSMKAAVAKVASDFKGARLEWPSMRAWVFVTNYMGIPAQITHEILRLQAENKSIAITVFGKEQFQTAILELQPAQIEDLIGSATMDRDFREMQPPEIFAVVDAIVDRVDVQWVLDDHPVEVPSDKLSFNGLDAIYQKRIRDGFQNAKRVAELLLNHPNPMLDSALAKIFKDKYLDLKSQGFAPGEIMDELFDYALAGAKLTRHRDVAVWSVLAHLFEKCTIFEDRAIAASLVTA